jgi:glutaryl-CoA dehydrogenase
MAYAGLDYYAIDELYTEEERHIRDAVRELVQARIMPSIGKHFQDGTFPRELPPLLGAAGLLGASLSGHGCPGASPTWRTAWPCQELERGDSGDPLVLLGAGLAGDVPDLGLRLRRTEAEVPAAR